MACFRRGGYSCFGPYYPCPVWTSINECDGNTVINPPVLPSFALYSLLVPVTVASGAVVPLVLITGSGTSVGAVDTGEIFLSAGNYLVTYNTNSTIGASGTNSFGLTLNAVSVPTSVSSGDGTAGTLLSLGDTTIVTVDTPSILRLVNTGEDAVTVNSANLTIQKIN